MRAQARRVPGFEPGTEPWMACMSASKVSAVLGLSQYESRYSLWHKMAGNIPAGETSAIASRGHYIEPSLVAWFRDEHPSWRVRYPGGTWQSKTNPLWIASPDGVVTLPRQARKELLECKTTKKWYEWGEPGSDVIPPGYMAQCQWQMFILGAKVTHFAVDTGTAFVSYLVEASPGDAEYLVGEVEEFMASLRDGVEPSLDDGADATYEAIRHLHPNITPKAVVELSDELAHNYVNANHAEKAAKTAKTAAASLIADVMGDAQYAEWAGEHIAARQAKTGGTPFVKAAPGLTNRIGATA